MTTQLQDPFWLLSVIGTRMHCPKVTRHESFSQSALILSGLVTLFSLGACALLTAMTEESFPIVKAPATTRSAWYHRKPAACATKKLPSGQLFQRTDEKNGQLTSEYGFVNFNNDPLHISFSFPLSGFSSYKAGYGYTDAELAALKQWQSKALEEALQTAQKNRFKQEQLNKMCEEINADYKAKHRAFLVSRGFTLLPKNILMADIPGIIKRNVKHLRPVAQSLSKTAGKQGYDADETISAALSLVQTAILYENIPMNINGRQTGGVLPPVETLTKGKGDCDTKTALLASILLNWDRMNLIGITVPGHYLMGILHNPAKGDAFIEYNGLRYILVEPAGPAWLPPGTISARTSEKLNTHDGLRIEPLVAN